MVPEQANALALQERLEEECAALAEVIAVPASRRDADAIRRIWADISRLRHRANSLHRRLRARVRRIKAEDGRADHALQRDLDAQAKLMGKRLRMWDSMDTLVRRHIDPEPVDLILRPIENDSGSLLTMIHRAFHRLANPNDQTREADEAGCFADIPMRVQKFDLLLSAAYRVLLVLGRTRDARFLDVGCGGATTVFVARRYFPHCDGLEYDADYARAGRRMLEVVGADDSRVFEGDGRTFDGYGNYDVIYFYRPLRDDRMLAEMERHIIDSARPGTILIAPYDFSLAARAGFDCAMLEEPVFITGLSQAEADELRHEACHAGHEILRRSWNFEFDPGFWTPILDAASFNGSRRR